MKKGRLGSHSLLGGLWRQPDFLKLWTGQTISLLGDQVSLLAIPLTAVLFLKANAALSFIAPLAQAYAAKSLRHQAVPHSLRVVARFHPDHNPHQEQNVVLRGSSLPG